MTVSREWNESGNRRKIQIPSRTRHPEAPRESFRWQHACGPKDPLLLSTQPQFAKARSRIGNQRSNIQRSSSSSKYASFPGTQERNVPSSRPTISSRASSNRSCLPSSSVASEIAQQFCPLPLAKRILAMSLGLWFAGGIALQYAGSSHLKWGSSFKKSRLRLGLANNIAHRSCRLFTRNARTRACS